jgi:hypothetical protein
MRRCLLLVAAVPLVLLAPPALAGERGGDASCRPPEISNHYDTAGLETRVKLPASGCPSREHSMFMVSARITRSDVFGPQESVWRSVRCGPFLAAEDQDPDDPPAEYFCDLDLALGHPEVETSDYEVEVTFPGAEAERTVTLRLVCSSDGTAAVCDKETA